MTGVAGRGGAIKKVSARATGGIRTTGIPMDAFR